jgi:hypothetical protein
MLGFMESIRHELHGHGPRAAATLIAGLVVVYGLGLLVYSVLLPLTG